MMQKILICINIHWKKTDWQSIVNLVKLANYLNVFYVFSAVNKEISSIIITSNCVASQKIPGEEVESWWSQGCKCRFRLKIFHLS